VSARALLKALLAACPDALPYAPHSVRPLPPATAHVSAALHAWTVLLGIGADGSGDGNSGALQTESIYAQQQQRPADP
jgi:hypothetical protein